MDPKALLMEAKELYASEEWNELGFRLHDYFEWRLAGGFCPMFDQNVTGDIIALDLLHKMSDFVK